ncbi:MAG: phage holin family protein [Patescibacteria group bacterium]|nr:phage holin family protein [Patescibacteria group bacterium]
MEKLFWHIVAGILAIFLAVRFITGVGLEILPESSFLGFDLTQYWHILIVVGAILGLINFFIKPILGLLTLPLKFLTLGLFSIILNMVVIWFLDILFLELTITNLSSLFLTTVIVWTTSLFLGLKK